MHSHHSSFVIDICMTIWLYFCSQQQHLLSLVVFANSSLLFIYIIYFSRACIWFDSIFHIQFHACGFLNEILQRVSLYINICIYFSLYLFFFCLSSCTPYIFIYFFAMGSFSRAHNYWHIYWYNKIIVRYIAQTLFCALFFFLNALWEWENTEQFWTKYPEYNIWNIEN